jgi:cytochrome c-type protein NapC
MSSPASQERQGGGLVARALGFVRTHRFKLLSLGFVVGIVFWGGFNTAMEATNTEAFCISCHEMKNNVFVEYRNTIHYQNRTGVRATCPDCHVPKEWSYKIVRKIQASNELLHKALGSIDTPEKFNAKRGELAQHEWDRMKRTDSRECRNCHNFEFMDYAEQNRRSASKHQVAFGEGQTCIDCHKGIAHTLPPIDQPVGAPKVGAAALLPSAQASTPPAAVPAASGASR